jgi:hypothetical protein
VGRLTRKTMNVPPWSEGSVPVGMAPSLRATPTDAWLPSRILMTAVRESIADAAYPNASWDARVAIPRLRAGRKTTYDKLHSSPPRSLISTPPRIRPVGTSHTAQLRTGPLVAHDCVHLSMASMTFCRGAEPGNSNHPICSSSSPAIHSSTSLGTRGESNRVALHLHASQHGDLDNLGKAVERLDQESKRIVAATVERVDSMIEKTITEMASTIQGDDGPLAAMLVKFDPTVDGNVIDMFRELVATTATNATKRAVKELAEATHDTIERLTNSMVLLEKFAAVEKARLAEAEKGTAKGLDHERDTESFLGELVSVTGDSLDDVSTVLGLLGTKKGDKTVTPRGGCMIVKEEKCTVRLSESKARTLLSEAMTNRGARLGMLIVEDQTKVPGNQPFHFIDDNMVVVVADRLALKLVYSLFRVKAIELSKASCIADDVVMVEAMRTIRQFAEDIERALERFRPLRTEHTRAAKAIGQAGRYVDEAAETIADEVAEIMGVIDALVVDAGDLAA